MSLGPHRLVFLVLFVVNCVLWSQSRYANVRGTQHIVHTEGSLVRRIALEWQQGPAAYDAYDGHEKEASPAFIQHSSLYLTVDNFLSADRWPFPRHRSANMFRKAVLTRTLFCRSTTFAVTSAQSRLFDQPPSLAFYSGLLSSSPRWASVLPTSSPRISRQSRKA